MQTLPSTYEYEVAGDEAEADAPAEISDERFAALVRLIGAVRNNKVVAPLSDSQMAQIVEDWHEVLLDVPTSEIKALRRRGIALGLEKATDFLAHYRQIEERRQQNAEEEARRREEQQWRREQDARARDPQGHQLSLKEREFQLQAGRHRRGLLGISCHCQCDGRPITATLDASGRAWKCASDKCDFRLPVEQTDSHDAGRVGPLGGGASSWNRPVTRPEETLIPRKGAKNRAEEEQNREDARACGFDLDTLPPPDCLNIRLFLAWLRARYEGPLSPEIAEQQWDLWARERASKQRGNI